VSRPRDGGAAAHRAADARGVLEAELASHAAPPFAEAMSARALGPYRGYGEVLRTLADLAARGAALEVIGHSVEERPLFAVRIAARAEPTIEPCSAVLSGVHPIEWIGVEAHLALLSALVDRPPTREVLAVPLVNPDGFCKVEALVRAGRRRFVRHNAAGVDLNRNFPAAWGQGTPIAKLFGRLYYPGSGPASEPEVEAVVRRLRMRRVDRALSLHSYGGAVLMPYAHKLWPSPRAAEHRTWAKAIARAAGGYRAVPCAWWLPGATAGGLELDWFHEEHGATSLLVECARGGLRFGRWRNGLEPFAWFNPAAPEAIVERLVAALYPFAAGES